MADKKKSKNEKASNIDIPVLKSEVPIKEEKVNVQPLIKLKSKAINILELMLPIMTDLADENSEIVKEIKFCCKPEDAVEWLQEQTLEAVGEAQSVNSEIDKFIKAYASNDIEKHTKEFPYMASIWFGDVYDGKEEIEAINELIKEFKAQYTLISKDAYFVDLAKKYKGKK